LTLSKKNILLIIAKQKNKKIYKNKYMKQKKNRSPFERLKLLSKKMEQKELILKKTENEKGYITRKLAQLAGKKCPKADSLKIQLRKKLNSIRHIKNSIHKIGDEITSIKENLNKS
jgi:hypothetical protein